MLDSAVRCKINKIEILLSITNLFRIPATEIVKEGVRILDEGPNPLPCANRLFHVCFGWVLVLKVGGNGKDRAEERTHADVFHRGVEIIHENATSAALKIAMVCKSIHDGAWTSAGIGRSLCKFSNCW